MSPAGAPDPRFVAALERAARWRLLAHVVTPPHAGWADGVAALASPALRDVDVGGDATARVLAASDEAAIAEAFGVLGPAGPVSACASDHVRDGYADKGPILADVAGFYEAFAFEPAEGEAPDHFSALLSFLSFLALKEAWALLDGDQEQVTVTDHAARTFESTHLHPYLRRFVERIEQHAPVGGLYQAVADLLESAIPTGVEEGVAEPE